MRRLLPFLGVTAALLSNARASAQSFWNTSVRMAPQFQSFDIKSPIGEKVTQFSVPIYASVPLLPALTVDIGTAFATASLERQSLDGSGNPNTVTSEMSGLTDTQVRASYAFGQDFVVVTAGVNLPTGSATVDAADLEAATRIGSDFLMFPISGFGSGLGFTGGVAVAKPVGNWNVGFGASLRHSSEYEPFRDASGATFKFQPGPEYRARVGADHPFGTGRVSFGLTFSQYGDDKSNAQTFNTGSRYVGQFSLNNALNERVNYSFVAWNMFRTSGTLINQSPSPSGNITNALVAIGVRARGNVSVEPSIETRVWTQQGSKTSYMGTLGMRFSVNRGLWSVVPGFGFSMGSMEGATLTGLRASLGMRLGGS